MNYKNNLLAGSLAALTVFAPQARASDDNKASVTVAQIPSFMVIEKGKVTTGPLTVQMSPQGATAAKGVFAELGRQDPAHMNRVRYQIKVPNGSTASSVASNLSQLFDAVGRYVATNRASPQGVEVTMLPNIFGATATRPDQSMACKGQQAGSAFQVTCR